MHNTFVTPDGRYVIAGSIVGKNLTVIDGKTEEPLWSLDFDAGVRPMAFEKQPDGSTGRLFVQLSNFHGFAVVDFETHREARLRRKAESEGLALRKSRGAALHGPYFVVDPYRNTLESPEQGMSLDEVAVYLTSE